jgi:protein-disulfide isomerase
MQLSSPVNEHDYVQGSADAPITLVQYGDFECPYSGAAYGAVKDVQQELGERLCYVFRQFPLHDIHPHAMRAAEAAEAAAAQGKFWPMYNLLFENQEELGDAALLEYARRAGLDEERFSHDVQTRAHHEQILRSIAGGKKSGAHGTPTFFINGRFFDNSAGLWDVDALLSAIKDITS